MNPWSSQQGQPFKKSQEAMEQKTREKARRWDQRAKKSQKLWADVSEKKANWARVWGERRTRIKKCWEGQAVQLTEIPGKMHCP